MFETKLPSFVHWWSTIKRTSICCSNVWLWSFNSWTVIERNLRWMSVHLTLEHCTTQPIETTFNFGVISRIVRLLNKTISIFIIPRRQSNEGWSNKVYFRLKNFATFSATKIFDTHLGVLNEIHIWFQLKNVQLTKLYKLFFFFKMFDFLINVQVGYE